MKSPKSLWVRYEAMEPSGSLKMAKNPFKQQAKSQTGKYQLYERQ
jgi:hypothetical protein